MDILKDTALSNRNSASPSDILHLWKMLCTSDNHSASATDTPTYDGHSAPQNDTWHLWKTPCNSNKHCSTKTYIRISDRNSVSHTYTVHLCLTSESLTGILHLLQTQSISDLHQNLWQEFCISYRHRASLTYIRISNRNSASLTYTLHLCLISDSLTGIPHFLHTQSISDLHQNLWQELCISYRYFAPLWNSVSVQPLTLFRKTLVFCSTYL